MDSVFEFINTKLINEDESIQYDFEIKYVMLNKSYLKIKDNENDPNIKSAIQTCDIVIIDNETTPSGDLETNDGSNDVVELEKRKYLIKIKTNSQVSKTWIFEFDSYEIYNKFLNIIKSVKENSGYVYKQKSSNYKYDVEKSSSSSKNCCSKLYKIWLSIFFIIYTVGLAALFGSLWVYYLSPVINVDGIETTCTINSHDWSFLSNKYYRLYFDVTYQLESGEIVNGVLNQYCKGISCPFELDILYEVGRNRTCFYEKDDTSFVYFSLFTMISYRVSIVAGICGSLLFVWFVLAVIL